MNFSIIWTNNHFWKSVTIKSGDTLASIFAKHGIASTTTHQIARRPVGIPAVSRVVAIGLAAAIGLLGSGAQAGSFWGQ